MSHATVRARRAVMTATTVLTLCAATLPPLAPRPPSAAAAVASSPSTVDTHSESDHSLAPVAEITDACSRPIGERVGGWFCPGDEMASPARLEAGRCLGIACWRLDSPTTAYARVEGPFGYGKERLGNASLETRDTYTGASHKSNNTFHVNRTATNVTLYMQRLDTRGTSTGTPVTDLQQWRLGEVSTGFEILNGWASKYNNSAPEQSFWHQATWNIPGYDGHWWVVVKSYEAKKLKNGGYTFYSEGYLPLEPYAAGWTR